ncbi:MAG: signal peptide peptidase SppA [Spirochaetia bacterium]|nr:signal peptide peptidase SppA [Spirochaetia bacterium]
MRKKVVIISIITLVVLFCFSAIMRAGSRKTSIVNTKKIGVVNVEGEIVDTRHIMEQILAYTNNPQVRAIVLRINSPGGGVGASQEVYRQIKKAQDNGMTIVVSMGDMAASGGYYIASAADRIYANPGTVTGSIGVIMGFMHAEKLMDRIGVGYTTIKTGKYKDMGNFSRAETPQERAFLQGVLNDVLAQFIEDVTSGRLEQIASAAGIKEKDHKKLKAAVLNHVKNDIADGRIITGREALRLGLVDEIGNFDDAIEGAAKMVGIKGRPMVLTEKIRAGFGEWLSSKAADIGIKEKTAFSIKYLLN